MLNNPMIGPNQWLAMRNACSRDSPPKISNIRVNVTPRIVVGDVHSFRRP
jgi:hypothetical protein